MKLKIISDGTGFNTQILDAETGMQLSLPIAAIKVNIEPDKLVEVWVQLSNVKFEATAEIKEANWVK